MTSEVIDFGTNRNRVCHFLLVRHWSCLLAPLQRYCRHFVLITPPLFYSILGCSRWTRTNIRSANITYITCMIYFVNLANYFACCVTDRFQSILQFARHRGVVGAGGRCQQVSVVFINAACRPALLQRLTEGDYHMPSFSSMYLYV